jgi:hypothetical protein
MSSREAGARGSNGTSSQRRIEAGACSRDAGVELPADQEAVAQVSEKRSRGFKHGHAGQTSNRGKPKKLRRRVLQLIQKKYSGTEAERFGPTLAAEHLAEEDGSWSTSGSVAGLDQEVWRAAGTLHGLEECVQAESHASRAVTRAGATDTVRADVPEAGNTDHRGQYTASQRVSGARPWSASPAVVTLFGLRPYASP